MPENRLHKLVEERIERERLEKACSEAKQKRIQEIQKREDRAVEKRYELLVRQIIDELDELEVIPKTFYFGGLSASSAKEGYILQYPKGTRLPTDSGLVLIKQYKKVLWFTESDQARGVSLGSPEPYLCLPGDALQQRQYEPKDLLPVKLDDLAEIVNDLKQGRL